MLNHTSNVKNSRYNGFSEYSKILPRLNFGLGGQVSSPQSFTAYSLGRQTKKLDSLE
jgi:hypothetical protein